MGGYTASFARQQLLNARELNLSAQTLDSAVTSYRFSCEGYNQATVEFDYTYGAGTSLIVSAEVTSEFSGTPAADTSTWRRIPSISWSSGTGTLSDAAWTDTGTASDAYVINIPLNYFGMRLVWSCGGSPTTSDLITAIVRLGVV